MKATENNTGKNVDTAINVTNAVLGALLFSSPWIFGFRADPLAAWNAWFCGALALFIALSAISRAYDWEEWLNLIVGLWTAASPWLLGFFGVVAAMWVHLFVGLGLVAFAAMELRRIYLTS
ncbi:SPW repeat protein [Microvirga alba]|uniref:SPW repeat protein n=1 Tax=Microvirga alba TaxID=2791025 RepID=A0A931BTR0_9HYPH|nr:SPW repeat protein [Microvirga alba]MBF9232652.1 SPW repeat protein [Microvirga alba]